MSTDYPDADAVAEEEREVLRSLYRDPEEVTRYASHTPCMARWLECYPSGHVYRLVSEITPETGYLGWHAGTGAGMVWYQFESWEGHAASAEEVLAQWKRERLR